MSFQIPTISADLLALGNKMYQGLVELGVALKMTQMTPAEFQVFLAEFKAADDDFNAGRSAQAAAKSPEPGLTTTLPEPLPARNGASANGHHARNGHAAPAPAVFSRVDEG